MKQVDLRNDIRDLILKGTFNSLDLKHVAWTDVTVWNKFMHIRF